MRDVDGGLQSDPIGFRVWGLGLRVWGLGFRAWGVEGRNPTCHTKAPMTFDSQFFGPRWG